MTKISILLALFCSVYQILPSSGEVVLCYYGTWARYRTGNGQCTLTDVANSASYCTHWIYTFMGLENDGKMKSLDTWLDIDLDNLNQFNALKNSAAGVKALLAIGGWNEGSTKFSNVVANSALRKTFVQSILEWVLKYGFDGFDLDWEYPAQRGGAAADKQNFVTLIKEIREAFDPHGLILTAAVQATGAAADLSYDVPAMSQYLDYINIMAYDLHGDWDGVTGHNAPLYASSIYSDKSLCVDASIEAWISRGASPSKLVLGLPTYGRTFALTSSANAALGASCISGAASGPYTQTTGYWGYNEIVEKFAEGGWTTVWDDEEQVPYAYKDNVWVGYDDPKAFAAKTKYAVSKGLAGVMIWSLETDDFKGLSGVQYPLLKAIKDTYTELGVSHGSGSSSKVTSSGSKSSSTSTSKSITTPKATTTTKKPTTASGASSGSSAARIVDSTVKGAYRITCPSDGFFRDSRFCSTFYQCTKAGVQTTGMACAPGLSFDLHSNTCNWAALVTDC